MSRSEIIKSKIEENYNVKLRIDVDNDFIKIKKNSVIGLNIYSGKDELIFSRYVPNFLLRLLPFSEMFFLALFYIPSSDFKKEIETLTRDL